MKAVYFLIFLLLLLCSFVMIGLIYIFKETENLNDKFAAMREIYDGDYTELKCKVDAILSVLNTQTNKDIDLTKELDAMVVAINNLASKKKTKKTEEK